MNALIDALKAEITDVELSSCEFTIGGQSFKAYARPITAQDMTYITRKHPNFVETAPLEGQVDMIIRKALDENGEKLFTLEHKKLLVRQSVTVIGNLFAGLFEKQFLNDQDDEEREKN